MSTEVLTFIVVSVAALLGYTLFILWRFGDV